MVLRLLALLFASAALLMGLALGWGWPLGATIARINPTAIPTLQNLVSGVLWQQTWVALATPMLDAPAWLAPALIALILFGIAAMRPGKG